MSEGWIKLHRQILDSEVFQNEALLQLFLYCALRANHAEAWVAVVTGKGKTQVKVMPGQFIFGSKEAAKATKQKPSSVRKRMVKLENMGNVSRQVSGHYTLVTVCNWHTYQSDDREGEQPSEQAGSRQVAGTEQAGSTNNNEETDDNEEEEEAEVIPVALNVTAFIEAWGRWHDYRREAGIKSWKPVTRKAKLKIMALWGPGAAIKAIDASIENGWQGLFEPDGKAAPGKGAGAPQTQYAAKSAEDYRRSLQND